MIEDRALENVDLSGSQSLDKAIQLGRHFGRESRTIQKAYGTGVGIVDIIPVRPVPFPRLLPRSVSHCLDTCQIGRTPVEVGDTETYFICALARTFVVVGDGPDLTARLTLLRGNHKRLSGIDTGDNHIITAVKEPICHLGGIGCYPRNIEPEADPTHLELQLAQRPFADLLPSVGCTQERGRSQSSRLLIDKWAQIADLSSLGG